MPEDRMPEGFPRRLRHVLKRKPLLKLRYATEYVVLRVVAWLVPKLSRPVVLGLAQGLGSIALRLDRRGRQLGLENIRLAVEHGQLDLGGRTADEILAACYQNFGRGFLDLFWFSGLSAPQLDRWVQFDDEDRVRQMLRADRGAIFLTPHFGMFEWASLIIGVYGLKLDIVAQDFKNPALTAIFRRARQASGHRVLSRDGAMLKLLRSVKRGGSIGLLPDLTVAPQGAAAVVNVFGIPTCMTAAHVEIARRCQAPMFVVVCEPLADGRVCLRMLEVLSAAEQGGRCDSQAKMVQAVWDHFENAIRQRPELWLWMYRHWRYRPLEEVVGQEVSGAERSPAAACRYPQYATPIAAFDSLYRRQAG